ncbi:hypothetical protein [Geothermobacter hydrogeniphilus]|nr:hypothetical protein [Geothermobacter hydrogeniphilus]
MAKAAEKKAGAGFRWMVITISALCLLVAGQVNAAGPEFPELVHVNWQQRSITFAAVVTASLWERQPRADPAARNFDPDHWHLIISATQANQAVGRVAIFSAWATDEEIAAALSTLGARGEKFDKRSFTRRMDADSSYPDLRPQGSKLRLTVSWDGFFGRKTVSADEFLSNTSGKKLDLVYIGKQHPSNCVICLYGCVGAVCPNRALTVRDYMQGKSRWSLIPGVLPEDGTRVWITIAMAGE